jgi:predicted DCC family thiol-disulfide oxidoreductase YuxK
MVILFDGVCNLCNGLVQFIIKRDKHHVFQFASLQSVYGAGLLKHYHFNSQSFETILLYTGKDIYVKSEAVIQIVRSLEGGWKMIVIFKIIPVFLRNYVYDLVAATRYKIFGRRESCMVPTVELKSKFIDDTIFSPPK